MTSDAILEAAQLIVLKDGYEKATTNYIAERAGVSIGSLYQYYPSKDAIISSLIEQTVSRIAVGVRTVLRGSIDLPLEESSRQIIGYMLNTFREHKVLLYSLSKQTPELVELTKNLSVEKFTHATNMALFEQRREEILVDDLDQALHVIEVAVLSNIRRYIMENPIGMTDEEFVEAMVRLFMGFLTLK